MAVARCYECSSCGGLVREASRSCNYCGSPIATLRCGRCFMMNVVEALHCIGCGAELGLVPVPHVASANWNCPRCRQVPLDAFESNDGIIHDCGHCGGQFVPHAVLKSLVERHQANAAAFQERVRPSNPLTEQLTYLPCPGCAQLMLRRNFGRVSGIIVDVCSSHGSWFDVGELPRILTFVASGGIVRGEAVRLAEARRPARATWADQAPSSSSSSSLQEDLADGLLAFTSWVRDLLR